MWPAAARPAARAAAPCCFTVAAMGAESHVRSHGRTAEQVLESLGEEWTRIETPAPIGRYVPFRRQGNLLYISGASARPRVFGKVPEQVGRSGPRRFRWHCCCWLLLQLDHTDPSSRCCVGARLMATGCCCAAERGGGPGRGALDRAGDPLGGTLGGRIPRPVRLPPTPISSHPCGHTSDSDGSGDVVGILVFLLSRRRAG